MNSLYNLSILSYYWLIRVASLFHKKAKFWVNGRKNLFKDIESKLKNNTKNLVWFHCASLGEFEQGRPVMEKLKANKPSVKILLTFFSPSGYEIRKNYTGADYIFYLPIDTPKNANRFINLIQPQAAFFVKYEFWFNYLQELKKRNIPVYLISGIFRPEQHFFKWYGTWFKNKLDSFEYFFVQNENSKKLLNGIGYNNVSISGDTRFDRVYEISKNTSDIKFINEFSNNKKILVAGSTWPDDEKILAAINYSKYGFKLIIAPHEIGESHINNIESLFKKENTIRYSKTNANNCAEKNILIIDNIGMLSSLYKYGNMAYIGGGFGTGIHNILEAATFGLPVIFGPNYSKFNEAIELISLGGAFSIENQNELEATFTKLCDENTNHSCSKICSDYVQNNIGATEIILKGVTI